MSDGLFGDLFDFDGNGELDSFEQAAEFSMFMGLMNEEGEDAIRSAGLDPDAFDSDAFDSSAFGFGNSKK